MTDQVVKIEKLDGGVLLVTLDREHAGNSVNGEVTSQLYDAVRISESDPSIRVVILTGAGSKFFCAGADLKAVASGDSKTLVHPEAGFAGFVLAKTTKPWIAAINGIAVGGGLELALTCDMIFAAENAKFGLPEVKVGIIAGAGGMYRLPKAIPKAIAIEMLATGNAISASRAFDIGLVNRLVKPGELMADTLICAQQIAGNAPIAVQQSLAIARVAGSQTEESLHALSEAAIEVIMQSDDAKEGPRAFAEKRKPQWQGK